MANIQAYNAALKVGGTAITGYIDSMSYSEDTDAIETTTFGTAFRSFLPGLTVATLDCSGHYDPGTAAPDVVFNAVRAAGTAVQVIGYPGGTATGQRSYTGTAFLTNYSWSDDVSDDAKWSATWQFTAAVTKATL